MISDAVSCDRTGAGVPLSEGLLVADQSSGNWSFISRDAQDPRDYPVLLSKLIESPESLVDGIAHLFDKPWFDPVKFGEFFTRLRSQINLPT